MKTADAAYKLLVESGHSMHVKDLTQKMLDCGCWMTTGKTPAASVDATISMDIKHHGSNSRFRRTGKSTFCANPPAPIASSATPDTSPPTAGPVIAAPGPDGAAPVSFVVAAERVLHDCAHGSPMHYRKITETAQSMGLLKTAGITPEATMYAALLGAIERKEKRGEAPLFVRSKGGLFALARAEDPGLVEQIDKHNEDVRTALRQRLREMDFSDFEELVGDLLAKLGFEDVEVTRSSGDGGIDVRGALVVGDAIRTRMAVQVKRWKRPVQAPIVQQVRGSLGAHEQGLIITTSSFSSGAWKEAVAPDKTPIALMDGKQLVNLLVQENIGVVRTALSLLELTQEDEP